jgi:hypothetical protein
LPFGEKGRRSAPSSRNVSNSSPWQSCRDNAIRTALVVFVSIPRSLAVEQLRARLIIFIECMKCQVVSAA